MKLLPVRHLWGVNDPWETALPRFAAMGYAAIETPLPAPDQASRFRDLMATNKLGYFAMAFTGGATVGEHLKSLREQIAAAKLNSALQLTVHGGQDRFTTAQALEFYRESARIEAAEGLPLAHETHRGRILFNPWITAHVLRDIPATMLCIDYSHWVVVSERLLDGEDETLDLCAKHTRHVHCRVGYAQGPQVPDPSAPEAKHALERHESWWTKIWAAQKSAGVTHLSFTPEFGPPEYLHTLPHTNVPVSDLATVCEWMRARYESTFANWNGSV